MRRDVDAWGDGARLTALGSTYPTKADSGATKGAYRLVEEEFYVLAGEVAVWLDGAESVARPGTFLLVPRGAPHGLRRVSDEVVRMVTVVSPAGLEGLFGAVVEQGEEALLDDPERLVALAAAFGTEILGDYPPPPRS